MLQALVEHRTHVAQLRGPSDLLDGLAEVVVDPDPAAVSFGLPAGVEVVHGVGDPVLMIGIRTMLVSQVQPLIELVATRM